MYVETKNNERKRTMGLFKRNKYDKFNACCTGEALNLCHVPNVDALWQGWDVEDNISLNAVVI